MCQVLSKSLISSLSAMLCGYSGRNVWSSTFLQASFESINSGLNPMGSSVLMVYDLIEEVQYALVLAWALCLKTLVSAIYIHLQSKWHTLMLNCLLVLLRIFLVPELIRSGWLWAHSTSRNSLTLSLVPSCWLRILVGWWSDGQVRENSITLDKWRQVQWEVFWRWELQTAVPTLGLLGKNIQGRKAPENDSMDPSTC